MFLIQRRTDRLSLLAVLCLAAMAIVSVAESGMVSPEPPQVLGNEGYQQLWLGRINGAGGALDLFGQALRSDSAFPYRWSDLGDALAMSDQTERARYCFDRAIELAPHDPQIRMRAANFHFRTGETEQALQLGATILRQTPEFDDMLFSSYIRMGGDLPRVLDVGIGPDARAGREFLRFLVGHDNERATDQIWLWMQGRGFVTRPLALQRTSWLIGKDRPDDASALWLRYVEPSGSAWRKTDWIENSGFENDWTGEGFDWRVEPCPGVTVSPVGRIAHGGRRSLRLRFDAAGNLDFHHISQTIWLSPGRYRLGGWVRTEDLSTDQGVAFSITSLRLGPVVDVSTRALTGTNNWTEVSSEFAVARLPLLARVTVVRRPSFKFDNRPKGTVWIDDVRLTRLP